MPTIIKSSFRDLSDTDLAELAEKIETRKKEVEVSEPGQQTAEFWNLVADGVKVYQEIEWRKRHPAIAE